MLKHWLKKKNWNKNQTKLKTCLIKVKFAPGRRFVKNYSIWKHKVIPHIWYSLKYGTAKSHSSIDHWNYFHTSKGHVTWIVWNVNRIPMHCGVAYESVHSLARGRNFNNFLNNPGHVTLWCLEVIPVVYARVVICYVKGPSINVRFLTSVQTIHFQGGGGGAESVKIKKNSVHI